MDGLPIDTLLEVFKYLQMEEVGRLKILSRSMYGLLTSGKFLQGLFQTVLNTNALFSHLNEAELGMWLNSLQLTFKQKTKELPFWGESTNGGIYGNHLKFWIGKTFTKSRRPNMVLSAGTGMCWSIAWSVPC